MIYFECMVRNVPIIIVKYWRPDLPTYNSYFCRGEDPTAVLYCINTQNVNFSVKGCYFCFNLHNYCVVTQKCSSIFQLKHNLLSLAGFKQYAFTIIIGATKKYENCITHILIFSAFWSIFRQSYTCCHMMITASCFLQYAQSSPLPWILCFPCVILVKWWSPVLLPKQQQNNKSHSSVIIHSLWIASVSYDSEVGSADPTD